MANALCNVGLSLGFSKIIFLPLPVTVIHLSSSFSPSSDAPAHRHSLPESSFTAYPPKSAENLMRGLKSTSSSSQIDLKWYPLYFLFHMHLSGSTRWGFLRWYFLQCGHVFFFDVNVILLNYPVLSISCYIFKGQTKFCLSFPPTGAEQPRWGD